MPSFETIGGEDLLVGAHGREAVSLSVVDDRFGRLARVRIDRDQAARLAWDLLELAARDPADGEPDADQRPVESV